VGEWSDVGGGKNGAKEKERNGQKTKLFMSSRAPQSVKFLRGNFDKLLTAFAVWVKQELRDDSTTKGTLAVDLGKSSLLTSFTL
jgi:hypothetical protein